MFSPSLIYVWRATQLAGGHVGIPILLLTMYFSKLRRLATLHNMLLTWVAASVFSLMLFYTGQDLPSDPPPSDELCLAQASLVYSTPVLVALSAFCLVYDSWIIISGKALHSRHRGARVRKIMLLATPWVGFAMWVTACVLVGKLASTRLGRDRRFFYCSFKNNYLTNTLAVFTAIIVILAIIMTVIAALKLVKWWRELHDRVLDPATAESRMGCPYATLRIGAFAIWLLVTLAITLISIWAPRSPVPDVMIGTTPLVVFLIFGTQEDILKVQKAWIVSLFCGRRPEKTSATQGFPRSYETSQDSLSSSSYEKGSVIAIKSPADSSLSAPSSTAGVHHTSVISLQPSGGLSRHDTVSTQSSFESDSKV